MSNAPLIVPEHLPQSVGEFELAEVSDEKTVWRKTWAAIAGDYKTEMIVFPQYSGWRVKYHHSINMTNGRPGGYWYYDKSDGRATFEDRREAEQEAITQLRDGCYAPCSGEAAGGSSE